MSEPKSSRAPDKPVQTSSWDSCQKNPGHMGFIPVKKFGPENLPEEYRHEYVMTRIGLIADLTCRLSVGSKSIHRPNRQLFYDVSKYRYGTGNVVKIIKNNFPRTWNCQICDDSHTSREEFNVIRVMTACHVVFDCKEAENTKIDLFYDDEVNLKDIKTLHGFRVISRNIDEDQCIFECTTDDIDLVTLLESKLSSFKKLVSESSFIYSAPCNIIASHPHGMSKHISVGAWRDNDKHETLEQSGYIRRNIPKRFFRDCCLLDLTFLPYLGSVIVSNKPESDCVSIECKVQFPDMSTRFCHFWQWDVYVRSIKEYLMNIGNQPGHPDQFYLELVLTNEETQIMQDDKLLLYYMHDLTIIDRIVVKRNYVG